MTNRKASDRIERAAINLTLDEPFFGMLTARFLSNRVESLTIPTSATDGKTLYYNPEWINTLTIAETQGALCHEDWHVALLDPWRETLLPFPSLQPNVPTWVDQDELLKTLRHVKANQAMDYRINSMILESGGTLPKGALLDPKLVGMAMEEIYRLLPDPVPTFVNGQIQCGDCGIGEVMPAPGSEADQRQAESDVRIAVQQAANTAKMQGRLPAGIERLVKELLRPKIDWRAVLIRFIQQAARTDYTWKRPSPRFLPSGLYMPCLCNEEMGEMVWFEDTSGSIGDNELQQFRTERNELVKALHPRRVHVGYCDAEVGKVDTFEQGEDVTDSTSVGGGGTDFRPPFKWVDEHGIEPVCFIYLTDLCGTFPSEPPAYPVLWVTITDLVAPWGETVRLEQDG